MYSYDTDVLLVALRRVPKRDTQSAVIIGTGEHSCKVMLKPIMTNLVQKASPLRLISCHALTGAIHQGIYKEMEKEKGCSTAYLDSSPTVLVALTELGEGAEPLVEVLKGCEESCSQYYVLNNSTYPNTILYGGISSNY